MGVGGPALYTMSAAVAKAVAARTGQTSGDLQTETAVNNLRRTLPCLMEQ
jgi:hypothetical protein